MIPGVPKAEHVDALYSLALNDATVRAYLKMREQGAEWVDVLPPLVLHLAREKADFLARLVDAERHRAP